MKVLIGTTNPAKVTRFAEFLPDSGIAFLTLKDLGITAEPEEGGSSPEENARIKAAYGDKIAFWGGIDTQHLLTEGTPEQVRAETGRILSILDVNGGYILSSAHTIQSDVKAENLLAIFEGAKEYYRNR